MQIHPPYYPVQLDLHFQSTWLGPHLSSQSSSPTISPSSHISSQIEGVLFVPVVHDQPGIGPEQSSKQPQLSRRTPSSQPSVPTYLPSPQFSTQTVGTFGNIKGFGSGFVQVQPANGPLQVPLHLQPSYQGIIPESHVSNPTLIPSLHFG